MSTLSRVGEGVRRTICPSRVSTLSDSTIKELQAALIEQLKSSDGPAPELTKLLTQVASEARQKKIKPEELLVVFKQVWNSLAESIRPHNVQLHDNVRETLVTLCIRAYYAE